MTTKHHRPDVLVVGGGPAGLVFALAAVRKGVAVQLIDKRRPPIDKPCGEGLMPNGLAVLADLGVDPPGRSFRGIRYVDGETVATGTFPEGRGRGVRRTELHGELATAAERAGVDCRWGCEVTAIQQGQKQMPGTNRGANRGLVVETSEGPFQAPLVVAADGLRSKIRSWAALDCEATDRTQRFGVRRHFQVEPWSEYVEVHWAEGCEAYITPVSPTEVGVAILWDGARRPASGGYGGLLEAFPEIAKKLEEAYPVSSARGCGPLAQCPRRCVSHLPGPLVLLGDAAGYLDAITGEGLSLAIQEAVTLAELVAEGRVEDLAPEILPTYERRVARHRRLPEALIRLLLFAEARPRLRRKLVATLARDEALFNRILAIHAGQRPLSHLRFQGALRLARGLL